MSARKQLIGIIQYITIFLFVFSVTGCGPSNEERQKIEKEEKLNFLSAQISKKHNTIYFPAKNIGPKSFTYELQSFFFTHTKKSILFKGYLEDIEVTDHGLIVKFLCPLGDFFFIDGASVRFRLTATENMVEKLLAIEREDPMFRYLGEPNFLVVVKIEEVKRIRQHEFDGSTQGDEIPLKFLSVGKLIEAVHVNH